MRVELDVRPRAARAHGGAEAGMGSAPRRRPPASPLDALAAISDTALTRETAIAIADSGLPNTFVPGRNLIFFTFAGALAYRRGARHLVAGMCETDYSGYPDCRDDTIKAMQVALTPRHGPALRHPYAADVDRQGGDLRAGPAKSAGRASWIVVVEDTHTCYLGDRAHRHAWGYGCGECPACQLARAGLCAIYRAMTPNAGPTMTNETRRRIEGAIFLVLFCLTIPAANWMIGNVGTICVPQRAVPAFRWRPA